MRQSSKVQGTKIAQAAKDLNVTSVTIRRYLSEFDIQTTTDANGIKVLPDSALEELKEVRRLKEEGLTNPKVMETLEEMRAKSGTPTAAGEKAADKKKVVAKAKRIESKSTRSKAEDVEEDEESEVESDFEEEEEPKAKPAYSARRIESKKEEVSEPAQLESEDSESSESGESGENGDALGDKEGRVKHSLTCQTCSKVFEHMNPKLRDCLDCYRTKRKERRRGGSDRHKTVIQHPIAQQVTSKMASQQQQNQDPTFERGERGERSERPAQSQDRDRPQRRERNDRDRNNDRDRDRNSNVDRNTDRDRSNDSEQTNFNAPAVALNHQGPTNQPMVGGLMRKVRSYRKAIEDTRQITGSLKRRLERPDLPEGERRWLEQIYAYQLILHQGWRHLSEYRMATQQQGKDD